MLENLIKVVHRISSDIGHAPLVLKKCPYDYFILFIEVLIYFIAKYDPEDFYITL